MATDVTARDERWRRLEAVYPDSPVHRCLGLTLEVVGVGETRVHYDGATAATNRRGHPAGGSLAEMIDSAVVQAAKTMLVDDDALTTTAELKVNFLRAAPTGAPLIAHGRIRHLGRTIAVGDGEIRSESGELCAIGLVTVSIRRKDKDSRARRVNANSEHYSQ